MKLKKIINKCYCGIDGFISNDKDFTLVEQYIIHNLEILKEFKGVIVASNYLDLKLSKQHNEIWTKYFPDCIILDLPENRGHSFGSADLDDSIFDYCKENNIEWLCKMANDILLFEELLEKEVDKSDFYYLEGIGKGGMANYNFDIDKILKEYFFPQTNFYIINVTKTDYLNNKDYINETYNECNKIPKQVWEGIFFKKPWGPFPGWANEKFLAECIERNNLSKFHLIPPKKFITLLGIVNKADIHDCSHKNIKIEGVLHFHNPEEKILILE